MFEKMRPLIQREAQRWEENHEQSEYEDVWSITDNTEVLKALANGINENVKKVLIPGCGSKTDLQGYLVDNYKHLETIYCTDCSQHALNQAKDDCDHDKIIYQKVDTSGMPFENNFFDFILVANSILSGFDLLNRRMIKECHRALKPGQRLYGFFPTILCAYEISYLDQRFAHLQTNGTINVLKNSFYESTQKMEQIFYTPLRLKHIVEEAGFKREKFEIYFFDSDYFMKESERVYGLPKDSGLCGWEILAILQKYFSTGE